MKILYIAPYFSFQLGGVSEVVAQSAKHLVQHGHQVTVLAGDYTVEKKQDGFPFQLVYLPSYSRWGFYVTPSLISWLRAHIREYDVVHLHEFRTFQNVVASYFAAHTAAPFFLTGHGTVPNIVERQFAKSMFDRLFRERILSCIDTFIAVSPKEAEDYYHLGISPSRVRLIYNGVDIPENYAVGSATSVRTPRAQDAPHILFLGRLHKRKKIDVLIRAFAVLHQRISRACLVLAGPDGGEKADLEQLAAALGIRDQVHFPGPVFGEQKQALYRSASVLVYPSAYEIFGLVPFEALLAGTPVVVTSGPGMGDIIEQAQAGVTVPVDDHEALAAALAWVLDHPRESRQQVIAGQRFISERLTWEEISIQLEKNYLEKMSRIAR